MGLQPLFAVRPIIRYPKGLPDYRRTFTPGNPRIGFWSNWITGERPSGESDSMLIAAAREPKGRHSRQFAEIGAAGTDKPLRLLLVGEARSGKQDGKIATRIGCQPAKLLRTE
jgi:hypothetical protein